MKASIEKDGLLKIEAENVLEAFALKEWWKDFTMTNPYSMCIDFESFERTKISAGSSKPITEKQQ